MFREADSALCETRGGSETCVRLGREEREEVVGGGLNEADGGDGEESCRTRRWEGAHWNVWERYWQAKELKGMEDTVGMEMEDILSGADI